MIALYDPHVLMYEPECKPWSRANTTGLHKDEQRDFQKGGLAWWKDTCRLRQERLRKCLTVSPAH
eukprot:11882858-Heterocapsa_arctica.AAC.1